MKTIDIDVGGGISVASDCFLRVYLDDNNEQHSISIVQKDEHCPSTISWAGGQGTRELGWINGYKYGVEYETNGKKPDLVGHVIIEPFCRGAWQSPVRVDEINWDSDNSGYIYPVTKFRIVDERCKPVDVGGKENKKHRIIEIMEQLKESPDAGRYSEPECSIHNKALQDIVAAYLYRDKNAEYTGKPTVDDGKPVDDDYQPVTVSCAGGHGGSGGAGYTFDGKDEQAKADNSLEVGERVRYPSGAGVVMIPDEDKNGVIIVKDDDGEYRRVARAVIERKVDEERKLFENQVLSAIDGTAADCDIVLINTLFEAGCRFTENKAAS